MSVEDYRPQQFEAPPDDRGIQESPEVHYEGTPTVILQVVDGVQQDMPHLNVDK